MIAYLASDAAARLDVAAHERAQRGRRMRSASTAIRHRPMPFGSLISTAMPASTFLPGCRPPRRPCSSRR